MNYNYNQTKSINKKISFNFEKELFLKNEKKKKLNLSVINNLDVLIENLLDQGVKFYKIDFFEEFNKIETVCVEVEDTINYCSINISMIELIYLNIKKENFGAFRIQCILATRTLVTGNISNSIKDIFNKFNEKIEVKYLNGYVEVKDSWNKLISDQNYKFHSFAYFSKFYEKLYGSLAELEVTFFPECGYDLSFIANALDSNIKGIAELNPDYEIIIHYLITIYMLDENLLLSKNKIYKKISKTEFQLLGSIDYLRKNNIIIFEKLKEKFPQQLHGLKILKLFNRGWNKFFTDVKINNHYLPNE